MKICYVIVAICCLLGLLIGCRSAPSTKKTLKVVATAVPHAEILEQVRQDLEEQGIELEIIVVNDYNTPNRVLADKEADANFFQHYPFLELQQEELGYSFKPLAAVHIEPMGLYSKKIKHLRDLADQATIAIPSDPTNQARALLLLEKIGLIKLSVHDTKASVLNIVENPKGIKFLEIDSPLMARTLVDVDVAAITTNFALQVDLSPIRDALAIENKDSPFVNLVVVREGDENREDLKALKTALLSSKVKSFIETRYKGAILPVF